MALGLLVGREYRQLQRSHLGTGIKFPAAYRPAILARNTAEAQHPATNPPASKAKSSRWTVQR